LLDVSQVLPELVEALCPDLPVSLDPADGIVQRRCLEPAGPVLSVSAAGDQPGAFEHLQVFRNRLQAHLEWCGQIVHGSFSGGQASEDRSTGRVGKGGEGDAQLIVWHSYSTFQLFNCLVDYAETTRSCQGVRPMIRVHDTPIGQHGVHGNEEPGTAPSQAAEAAAAAWRAEFELD
jgi:hypothetical protein